MIERDQIAFGAIAIPIDQLDPLVREAIERAEQEDGFRYGAFFDDGKPCFVSVLFYPQRRWLISYREGEPRPLTADVFVRLERIKLT